MKFKNLVLVLAGLAFAGTAGAQSSGLGFVPTGFGTYSSSTLQLSAGNFVNQAPFGVFAGIVPDLSNVQGYATVISGLSSSPETVDIPDFFQFGPSPGNNQYVFTLTSITETSLGFYQGAGTLVDNTGAYTFTDSTFTLGANGSQSFDNYNVTFDTTATAVPEPTTLALACLGGFAAFVGIRRRR